MNRFYIYTIFIGLMLTACDQTGKSYEKKVISNIKPLYAIMGKSEIKRTPDPRLIDFRETPKWEYTPGLVCSAIFDVYQKTNDVEYLDYVRFYLDSMINVDGSIKTYSKKDFNIDRVNSGKVLFDLYKIDPNPKYKKALDTLRNQMLDQPRTSEGGFWHKKIYPYQMWLDGLYMASPFLAQYAVEFDEPVLLEDVANQFDLINKYAYDKDKKLYSHGWDESREQQWANMETGRSPEFWGRAMGWFVMAMVDVLDYYPVDHPKREGIIAIMNKTIEGLAQYQDEKTGLWYQVLDKAGEEGNYLETSCSSMFAYGIMKGVQKGYLDNKYLVIGTRAFEGIVENYIVENDDGTISLTNICGVAGLGGNPYRDGTYEYYIGEIKRDNDPKGVGPFIMASIIYESIERN